MEHPIQTNSVCLTVTLNFTNCIGCFVGFTKGFYLIGTIEKNNSLVIDGLYFTDDLYTEKCPFNLAWLLK